MISNRKKDDFIVMTVVVGIHVAAAVFIGVVEAKVLTRVREQFRFSVTRDCPMGR